MKHRKRLIVLDFDSTLFDLPAFIRALPEAAAAEFGELYGINSEAFAAEIKIYYVNNRAGDPIGYDVYAHFGAHGLDLSQAAVRTVLVLGILAVHKQLTGRDNLLYEDVPAPLDQLRALPDTDIWVVTVNVPSGYEFKLELCGGHLEGIRASIVEINKGRLFTRLWIHELVYQGVYYDLAVVVDDHPKQIEAVPDQPNIRRLQIVRIGQRYPANAAGIRVIDNFGVVPDLAA